VGKYVLHPSVTTQTLPTYAIVTILKVRWKSESNIHMVNYMYIHKGVHLKSKLQHTGWNLISHSMTSHHLHFIALFIPARKTGNAVQKFFSFSVYFFLLFLIVFVTALT
jgi:hypothetical protein